MYGLLYLAGFVDTFIGLLEFILFILAICLIIYFFNKEACIETESKRKDIELDIAKGNMKKGSNRVFIASIVIIIVLIFIPSSKTLYLMSGVKAIQDGANSVVGTQILNKLNKELN